jgi:hypothetical protein
MLFTVTATFSDFTNSVHQYEAISADDAVRTFVATHEALAAYDKTEWFAKAPDNVVLTHAAGMRGVWLWHPTIELAQEGIALCGGEIVQTDPAGPLGVRLPWLTAGGQDGA